MFLLVGAYELRTSRPEKPTRSRALLSLLAEPAELVGVHPAVVREAAASNRSLREVAREKGVGDDVLHEALDYRAMAKPPSGA